MKRIFTLLITAIMLMITNVTFGQTRADEVYSTCLFGSEYNSQGVSSYTSTWNTTNDGFTWTVVNGNNNNNNWSLVKFGRKNNASIGTITTSEAYSEAITKVELTIDAVTTSKINSIKLYTSSDNELWNVSGEFEIATGVQTVTLTEPSASLYYKIEFDCASGSSNGLVTVSKVEFYYNGSGIPSVSTPTFSPEAGLYTTAQTVEISCETEGATIYYTLDETTPTTSSSVYSAAIEISETTTVKAIGVKDGMDNSNVATATYTIQELTEINTVSGLWDYAETVGTTATLASVTFNDWYVTGVKSSQAWISDGQYGFVIFQSGHGFNAGDKLNGTVVCNVLLFQNHFAEITGVKAENLTVTSGQEMPVLTTTISALQVRNYGTAIDLGTLTYNGSAFVDDNDNTIALYNQFSLSPNPISSLESGKQYNVKGVSIIYWPSAGGQTQQVAPRSAADFEEVVSPTLYTVSVAEGIANGTVTVDPASAEEGATITVTATPAENYELTALTYTYEQAEEPISIIETKQFVMPAADVTVDATFTEIVIETVSTPTFSPEEGSYTEEIEVSIACETEGATIYYTTDGTDPTTSSSVYSDVIAISTTTTIKAYAVKDGMNDSDIATATYTITIVPPTPQTLTFHKLVNHTDVTNDGTYMIVDVKGGYALTSANGTSAAPSAVAVTIVGDSISGEIDSALQWNFTSVDGGYRIKPINNDTLYLYSTSYNNGIRVGTNDNNVWQLDITDSDKPDYHGFMNVATSRYLGVYNNQDWRSYTSIHNNIKNTTIEIFVLGDAPTPPTPTYYTVNVAEGIVNGTVTVDKTSAEENEIITVTATPADNYELSTLTYTYGTTTIDIDQTTMQFAMPAADVTVNATFALVSSVAAPAFSLEEGSYITAQELEISCDTDEATIYYTVDGTDPTTETGLVYAEPIAISETMTVKAFAVKAGMVDSDVTSATFTIIEPVTIASARALELNEYALVQGVVTFIDGRNVYVQDETAGIVLYLNSNTVPDALAMGDMVLAYGKRAAYKGLVELSGINGGDENQFVIVSNGNELPVAVKTIAEVLTDFGADNMLQSTRVQIVDATIGAINTSGNTPIYQDENTLNLYKMPEVEGLLENDIVTIIGVVGCYNAVQIRIASAEDVTFTHPAYPIVTGAPTELTGLNYVEGEGPSEPQAFVLNGANLTTSITIHAAEDYEVSYAGGDNFTPMTTMTLSPSVSGIINNVTVYTRLKADLEIGTYDETMYINSSEIDTVFITVSGSVTEAPIPSDYTRITDLSQLSSGAKVVFAARYNDNTSEYYAMTAQASGKPTGVLFTSAGENLPTSISDEEETYYWTVETDGTNYTFTNASGDVLGYTSGTNFATGGDNTAWTIEYSVSDSAAMVPVYNAFVITNANNTGRAVALNSSYNFGPYSKSNMTGNNAANYNFLIDMFATEGGGTPVCATPTFTPDGGTYFEAQSVTISCNTAEAVIYYTLDGTDPTENSLVYSEPITVAENMTIKAIAMKEGYDNSNIAEAEYTIIIGAVTIFSQDWEGDMNGWTFVTVEGEKPWTIGQYQGNHYAYGNGYNGGVNEQWCISPAFDLDSYSDVTLSFVNAKNYSGPDMQLYFSNDYDGTDPTAATWTELSFEMSTGSFAWVESGTIEFTGLTGTSCYIGFKYTSTETEAAAWEVDDIVLMGFTSDPMLSVSTTALAGFTYMEGNGPSNEHTFNISGNNLTENVTLTMSDTSFEMSLTSGDEFIALPTIAFTPDNGTVSETIYVRMASDLAIGDYSGTITVESELDDITVSLNGSVVEQGDSWNKILSLSDLEDGSQIIIAARYDATLGDSYYAMTAGVSGKPEGVLFTSEFNGGVEMLPSEIASEATTYLWNVTVNDTIITLVNAAGDSLGYPSSGTNFSGNQNTDWSIVNATAGEGAMVPNHTAFVITNVSSPNRGVALNTSHNFGAYSTSNLNSSDYNFYVDIFVQGGSSTPTVATPVFSMASGTYYEAIEVEITCATEDATIYYTTDGSEPTAASTVYTSAIAVGYDMTIKAIAMKDGYDNSGIASASYVIMTDVVIILDQDWEGDMNGWTFVTVEGNKPWTIGEYNNNHYANANGYNDDVDNEQWCISPAFNLTQYAGNNVTLTFINAKNYSGPDMELYFTNDYDGQDPTAADWQPLTYEMSTGGYAWTESGNISLNAFSGQVCYIGFRYLSTVDDGAAAWEVDDIMVFANMGEDPYITATPNALSGFTHVVGYGPSEAQTFVITGGNLPPAPGGSDGAVIVSCDNSHYEFSLDGNEYDLYLNIPVVGTLEPTTIYVRLNGEEAGDYNGVITIEDYVTATVSVSGTVTSDGIGETFAENISIWNNVNELMIENGSNGTLEMMVFNIAGQPVIKQTLTEGSNIIRHDLAEGVYIVRFVNGRESTSVKVVVRR